MTRPLFSLVLLSSILTGLLAADAPPATGQPAAYSNDFEKTPPGKAPEEFAALAGDFTVREEAGNRFLEVAPEPLDTFGLLFGPDGLAATDVRAKIFATAAGKRFPEFGVGCGDAGGFKLYLVPGQEAVELRKGDEPVAHVDYKSWQSGQWTNFRLRANPGAGGKWRIEGKVWPASAKEPEDWAIAYDSAEAPPTGRASLWASPYSETPVRFDDLAVTGSVAGK